MPNKLPGVTITSPKDGDTLKETITIGGTATDEDGTVEKVDISTIGEVWTTVAGTDSWTYEWNTGGISDGDYTIRVRSYDGANFSETVSITVTVQNVEDGGGGSDDNFLFHEIGPLPLIGYVGIVLLIGIVVTVGAKNRKSEGGMTPGTTLSPTPPRVLPPQQPPMQYVQPQAPQQYPPQVSSPSIAQSPSTPTPWTCPQCSNPVDGQFVFCLNCGCRKGS